jgi:hypothetical protein
MGKGGPKFQTTRQDRIDWARPEAQARLGLGREFFMPGGELVPRYETGKKGKRKIVGYDYKGGDFRDYADAGGPLAEMSQFDTEEMRGRGMARGLIGEGDPYTDQRRAFARDALDPTSTAFATEEATARGDMLNANPYVDQMFNRAADNVVEKYKTATAPALQGAMIGAGKAYGSQAQEQALRARQGLSQELSGLATDIYGGNYAAERDMQMQAARGLADRGYNVAGSLGQYRTDEFGDADRMRDLGFESRGIRESNAQRRFTNASNAFQFQERQPFDMAALQDSATAGTGTGTAPTGNYVNPYAVGAGLGAAALGAA